MNHSNPYKMLFSNDSAQVGNAIKVLSQIGGAEAEQALLALALWSRKVNAEKAKPLLSEVANAIKRIRSRRN